MTRIMIPFLSFLLFSAGACDSEPPGAEKMVLIKLTAEDLTELSEEEGGGIEVCDCATDACVEQWIDEHIGCDVCVVLGCEAGEVHGCVYCPPDIEDTGCGGTDQPEDHSACPAPSYFRSTKKK